MRTGETNKIERYGMKDFDGLDCRLAVSRGRDEGKFAENPRESKSLRLTGREKVREKGKKNERKKEGKRKRGEISGVEEGSTTYYLVA